MKRHYMKKFKKYYQMMNKNSKMQKIMTINKTQINQKV